jgi:hypothetical protein
MINGSDIETVVRLFKSRNASLYHSCQLVDFESYLQMGAIASEKRLAGKGLPATGRLLDGTDAFRSEENVVFSLSDHGDAFAKKRYAAPNPDGPIMFQLDPGVLKKVPEIDIYLRPAAGSESKRLSLTAKDIPYLFRYTDQAPYPERLYIRTPSQIQEAFGTDDPMIPEISCRTTDETFSLEQVSATMVDNYLIFKRQLRDWAYDAQRLHGASLPLKRRYCPADTGGHLADALAAALLPGPAELEDLSHAENEELSQWAQEMAARRLQEDFRRYAAAFRAGTLLHIEQHRDRLLSSTKWQAGERPSLPLKDRQLVDRMAAEKVPPASIARITDLPLEDIEAYLKQKS